MDFDHILAQATKRLQRHGLSARIIPYECGGLEAFRFAGST